MSPPAPFHTVYIPADTVTLLHSVYITADTVPHYLCPRRYCYMLPTALPHYRYHYTPSTLPLVLFRELHLLLSPSSPPLTDIHIWDYLAGCWKEKKGKNFLFFLISISGVVGTDMVVQVVHRPMLVRPVGDGGCHRHSGMGWWSLGMGWM
jgi:hypothetical protein